MSQTLLDDITAAVVQVQAWKQVDILISKNQALQILYLTHHVYNETS